MEMIREAALRTKGAGGPCVVDANGFRRILACKSFRQSSSKLCDALARMTKIMCTQYIDPTTIEPLMASRLIPLDKGEGAVRPIRVGEVLRGVLAKCVMNVAKGDVAHASGSLQLCAGQKSGSEAALVDQIMSQQHQLPDDSAVKLAKQASRHKREEDIKDKVRGVYERAPNNLKRVLDLSSEKGSSVC